MSEAEVKEIFDSHDKKALESEGLLTRLLRQMFIDIDLTLGEYNSKMVEYLNDPRNRIPQTAHARSSERGNMLKDISNTRMSWRAFTKQIRLLAPISVRFEIHAQWKFKKRTITSIEIPLNADDSPEGCENE